MVVLVLAMSVATLLSSRQLVIIQACVQSVIVVALAPTAAQGFGRWLDAVVGCALALLVATVAPGAPLRKPARLAAQVLDDLAATLEACASELKESDEEAGRRGSGPGPADRGGARAELNDATAEGWRWSGSRRSGAASWRASRRTPSWSTRSDHASRNLRVLARRCAVALWRGEEVPAPYRAEMVALAEVMRFMAMELRNAPAAHPGAGAAGGHRRADRPPVG